MTPGIYPDLSMAAYLDIDALSCTPVRYLIDECPRAGWWRSRMNPNRPREESADMDIGTAAHAILLEGSRAGIVAINPADYPTKTTGNIPKGWTNDAIRAARDKARAEGKQPILTHDLQNIENMVYIAQEFIESLYHTEPAIWKAFQTDGGQSETVIVWEEDGIGPCKLRTDRNSLDWRVVCDYKTTGMSVEPDRFARSGIHGSLGYGFGAAWYRRGILAATGILPSYLWLAQETEAPYLCSLTGETPDGIALGDEKVAAGLKKWAECLRTGQWDGYVNRVCYVEAPPWERARWDERVVVGKDGIDYASQA